jgi:hypothetical protein
VKNDIDRTQIAINEIGTRAKYATFNTLIFSRNIPKRVMYIMKNRKQIMLASSNTATCFRGAAWDTLFKINFELIIQIIGMAAMTKKKDSILNNIPFSEGVLNS